MVLAPDQFGQPSTTMPGPGGPEPGSQSGPFSGLFQGTPQGFGDLDLKGPEPLLGDRWPENDEEYDKLLDWCQQAFKAAEGAKSPFLERWARYYKLYRSHVEKKPGDWHSHVFIPICFWIIETITPRLVAQLPKFTAHPHTAQHVGTAKNMETALEWASDNSKLFVELVKAFKSSLKYGTGILKTYHKVETRKLRTYEDKFQPVMQQVEEPVMDPVTGDPAMDMDGNPFVTVREMEVGQLNLGKQSTVTPYVAYDGPAAKYVDLGNFWVAPESEDVQSARYVIDRSFIDRDEFEQRVADGIYRWPSNLTPEEMTDVKDDPALERLLSIGLGGGHDPTRKQLELLEFWLKDGRKMVMVNRKALVQCIENPFDHSEKPFVRIVDYLQEGEFWGVGEIEPIEGLQDAENAISNSRIDNIRLLLNAMFFVNTHHVEDVDDFEMRPGGIIKGRGDYKPDEVFQRIDIGQVNPDAWTETGNIEMLVQKVTGVTDITMGLDNPGGTATESAILSEMGSSRFGMKSKLIEIEGLSDLGRQFASLLQQFLSEERQIRLGLVDAQTGGPSFAALTPESIQGAFDIGIESESTTQSATVRQEQKMNLLGLMAQFWPQGIQGALEDLLDAMGIKDKEKFLNGQMPPHMQPEPGMGELPPGEGAPPEGEAPAGPPPGADPNDPSIGTEGDQQAEREIAEIAAAYEAGGSM